MSKGTAYSHLIENFIERQYEEERLDQAPEHPSAWLPGQSFVQAEVAERGGRYIVYLLFVDLEDPACFARIPVRSCPDLKTAEIVAAYKSRLGNYGSLPDLRPTLADFDFSQQ